MERLKFLPCCVGEDEDKFWLDISLITLLDLGLERSKLLRKGEAEEEGF